MEDDLIPRISLWGDFDESQYLLDIKDEEGFEYLVSHTPDNPYHFDIPRCGCERDCCGCLCAKSAYRIEIFGRKYIAVKEEFNY